MRLKISYSRQHFFLHLFDAYTVIVWILLILEFFTKEKIFLPAIMTTLYVIILTFYASDKEIRRWRHRLKRVRRGEVFVYLWILTLVFIVAFYLFYGQKGGLTIPHDLPTVTGSVVIIYIITDILKEEFKKRK